MKLLDLLKAVHGGRRAFHEGDQHFPDIVRILDNEGSGVLEALVRTITTERVGEIGRCTAVNFKGLSRHGHQLLKGLAGEAYQFVQAEGALRLDLRNV
jgi:hypothetical protein